MISRPIIVVTLLCWFICCSSSRHAQTPIDSFRSQVIGNRLAQVHFYKKEDGHDSADTMETLVHKTSGGGQNDRNLGSSAGSHVQYSSMSNTNLPSPTQASPTPQIIMSQPAPITKAAKPVRDSAQFVSDQTNIFSRH